jgi:hypothetical protein
MNSDRLIRAVLSFIILLQVYPRPDHFFAGNWALLQGKTATLALAP